MSEEQPQYQEQYETEGQQQQDDDSEDEWSAPAKQLEADNTTGQHNVTEVNIDSLEGDEKELAGDVVPIVFHVLANGETFRRNYVMGHTVSYIKGQLEDLKGWPYERMILMLNGKTLIDPLSLNDLPFVARQDNVVEVTFTPQ